MPPFPSFDDHSSTSRFEFQNSVETPAPESASDISVTFTNTIHAARSLEDRGRLSDAVQCLEMASPAAKDTLGLDHPVTLEVMSCLGRAYGNQRRLRDAAELLKVVLEKRCQLFASHDARTLETMNLLAWTRGEQGDSAQEKSAFEEQQGHIPQAKTIANEALTLLAEAERLYKMVFDSRSKALGHDHCDALQTAANLAWVYGKQGRTGEAIELFETVLGKREQILGEGHPDKLWIINCLAKLYQEGGRLAEAEENYKKLLEILQGSEERDPHIDVTQHNLAWIYGLQGRTDEAIEMQEELLEKARRNMREEHPQTLGSMNNLACMYLKKGRVEKALSVHRKVYFRRAKVLGKGHRDTVRSGLWIRYIEHELGRKGTLLMPTEVAKSLQSSDVSNGIMAK